MAETTEYDLIVIGGGPAGYAAAIRAGQLGRRVVCIELERVGGTCLNWGCIPTKALLKSAELYQKLRKAETFGLSTGGVGFDFGKVMDRSRAVAAQMAKGVEFLFKKNKVVSITGRAEITAPGTVTITEGDRRGAVLQGARILVATGCRMKRLPGLPYDANRVITSREALALRTLPRSVLIVGAGAIGVEFAYFYNAFGAKVTLVEALPQLLPQEDEDISRALQRSFDKQGIATRPGTKCEHIRVGADSVQGELVTGDQRTTVEAEVLLTAVGVTANLVGVFGAGLAPALDRDFLQVNERYETSLPGVFAAGDIIGPPWLAHVATWEALQAVNGMFGGAQPKRVKLFPGCTYCVPQVASIGLTERAAKERGLAYKVGKFPFLASGKAVAAGEPEGMVKVVADAATGAVLGAHILGAEATELIAEFGVAMGLEATVDDIHHVIHAHPTLSEAAMEAAAAVRGEAVHI